MWLAPLPSCLAAQLAPEEAGPGTRVQGWAWGVRRLGGRRVCRQAPHRRLALGGLCQEVKIPARSHSQFTGPEREAGARGKLLGRKALGIWGRGPGPRRAGAAALVTLSGYFSTTASRPGRPVAVVLGKGAGPPPARAGEPEGSGGRVCPLRRSRGPPGGTGRKHATLLPLRSTRPLPAASKGAVRGPPSESAVKSPPSSAGVGRFNPWLGNWDPTRFQPTTKT